jgi:Spy/CpxP family protein refolding chaperone
MWLQRKKLFVSMAVVVGLLVTAFAQAQTSSQNPPAAKAKAKAAAASAQAPATQEPAAPPPPPAGNRGMGAGMGWGMGPGMGGGMGQGMMGGRGMQQPMMGRGMGRAGGRGMRPGANLMAQLNLTEAQKSQLKAIQEQQTKDGQAVRERLRDARAKLREAMRADIPDEAAVKVAAGAVASLQAEQFVLQARVKGQRMKVFTPEQQKQLKDARARISERAERQMMRSMRQQRLMRQGMGRQWRDGI